MPGSVYGSIVYGGGTYVGAPALTAFDYELAIAEGRIEPANATPVNGDYLLCLGSDRLASQEHDLAFGDNAYVEQSIDVTGINFINAVWRIRQPEDMPSTTTIPSPGVLFHNVLHFADPTKPLGDHLLAIVSAADVFQTTDVHRIVQVSGATNPGNNGDKRITGVLSPRIAIIDDGIVATQNPLPGPATATLLGARWKASISVAGIERASVIEAPGKDITRLGMQAHVSKLLGPQTVRFKLELVEQ